MSERGGYALLRLTPDASAPTGGSSQLRLRRGIDGTPDVAVRSTVVATHLRAAIIGERTFQPAPVRATLRALGTWRSPVAHLNGVQGVAGSNPAVPIDGSTVFRRAVCLFR